MRQPLLDLTHVALGPLADGDKIVVFTAVPKGGGSLTVQPESGLQIALSKADTRLESNCPRTTCCLCFTTMSRLP